MEHFPDLSAENQLRLESLREELALAKADLTAHMASWEYAYAMGSTRHDGGNHPFHVATRDRTAQLAQRVNDLKARLAEFEL
jgi:hypothetical protein